MHEFVRQYLAYNTKEIYQRSVVRLHPAGCDHGRGVVHGGQLRVPPVPRQHDRHQVGARVTCLSITRVTRVQVRDQPRRVRGRDRPHLLRARAVLGGECVTVTCLSVTRVTRVQVSGSLVEAAFQQLYSATRGTLQGGVYLLVLAGLLLVTVPSNIMLRKWSKAL